MSAPTAGSGQPDTGLDSSTAAQVYRIPVEEGEVVAPGLPLMSLIDLAE